MVPAQKQKYRSMVQDRMPRAKSTHIWAPNLRQRRQEYTREKRQPLQISGAGKTGQLHVKNDILTLPNTIHKNKLQMD